jgi:Immunity protein 30
MSRNLLDHKPLIEVLEVNRLLRSPDEVALFEQTLEKLAQTSDPVDLSELHLILDDACEQPEVMFSLVHFLESFEVQKQIQAFIQIMPDLVKRAAEWTMILHSRIMKDESARSIFEAEMRSMKDQKQDEIYQLLLLISTQFASEQNPKVA